MKNTTKHSNWDPRFFAILLITAILLPCSSSLSAARMSQPYERLPLGSPAPDFQLKDVVTGKVVSRNDFKDKQVLVVIFLCRHCPYVQHVKGGLAQLARAYAGKSVAVVGISSNDPDAYPEDAPESLKEMALQEKFTFPVLFDETQQVAKAYTAVCTPDPFVFDSQRRLVYRGQFDDSRPGSNRPVTGKDLRAAIDDVLAGRPVNPDQKPAVGCSIKWRE